MNFVRRFLTLPPRSARALIATGLTLATLVPSLPAAEASKAGPPAARSEETPPSEADLPFVIRLRTSKVGGMPRGDEIKIVEVRSDRKRIEVGGTYLVKGTYQLSSKPTARLSLSITSYPGSSGRSKGGRWDTYQIERGTGTFTLVGKMTNDGDYHVSFYYPADNGRYEAGAGIYFY
jgi:hypothetical protein